MAKKEFVVIAAYNEQKYIGKVVKSALKHSENVIVVDDGSRDATAKIAKSEGATVIRMKKNSGKGAAARAGCDYAVRQGAGIIVLIDGDGQHSPEDIPKFIKALRGKDIVFGARKLSGQMPWMFRIGNFCINLVTFILFGICLKDTQCGFRAMTSEAYRKIRWKSDRYSMESETVSNAGKHRLKYAEVEIKTVYHDKYKGTTPLDGIKILGDVIMWRIGLK